MVSILMVGIQIPTVSESILKVGCGIWVSRWSMFTETLSIKSVVGSIVVHRGIVYTGLTVLKTKKCLKKVFLFQIYSPTESSSANKVRVAEVIAHELAHQWFGNLMTLEWWQDLW